MVPNSRRRSAAGSWEEAESGKREQDELRGLYAQLAALVEAHDAVVADGGALAGAQASLADLLTSGSIEEATGKLDALANAGKLDPALMLTLGRAYNGVKESQFTRDEVRALPRGSDACMSRACTFVRGKEGGRGRPPRRRSWSGDRRALLRWHLQFQCLRSPPTTPSTSSYSRTSTTNAHRHCRSRT